MELGLLGKNISYSFSKKYFTQKFKDLNLNDYTYSIFDIQNPKSIPLLFEKENLKGFNVTIPYKQEIIKYLDHLSPEASEIGAVNTVKIENSIKTGYNTDAIGFQKSFTPLLSKRHTQALVLGSGGASKAVCYVLKKLRIDFQIVSHAGDFNYDSLTKEIIKSHLIIINTTPIGTFPEADKYPPIPVEFITENHLVYDLVYNPEETALLKESASRGAIVKNGLEMLHIQAEAAWEIWNRKTSIFY